MDFSEIYRLENDRLREIRKKMDDENLHEEQLREAFRDFAGYYEELLKQLQFIITVSDRLEKRVHKANESLEHKNRLIDEQNKQLLELNATKDKFFSIIAHDLKNPMQSLVLSAHMLRTYFNQHEYERMEKHIDGVDHSVKHSINLLENLLNWARAQTGRLRVNPEEFLLQEIFEESIAVLEKGARDKDIEIVVKMSQDEHQVEADRNMITTVLRNLLSNALKFSPKGSKILINVKATAHSAVVQVADQGVGIPEDRLQNLFKVDATQSTPGTENEKGTGLGLILCKEFIEKNNGDIWVESSPGEGSRFYFSVPLSKTKPIEP